MEAPVHEREELLHALRGLAGSPNPTTPPPTRSVLCHWRVALEAYRATTGIGGTTICSHATSPAELLAVINRPLPSSPPELPSPQLAARLPSSVALGQRFAFGQLGTCLHREGRGHQPADLVADLPSQASALMNSPGGGTLYWGLQQTQQGLVVAGMEPPSDSTMAQAVEAERDYAKTYHRVERPTGEPGPLVVVAFTFRPRPGLTCLACPLFVDRHDPRGGGRRRRRRTRTHRAARVQIKIEVKEEVKEEEDEERHEQVKNEWPLARDIAALLREKPDKSWITQDIRRALHQRRVNCSKLDINRTLHKSSGVFIGHKDGGDTVWRLK
ncbi:uncharacterized protein ACA1_136080 [Acanthamoeba castellanii str. Neff]|uniref:Uncharacterized protein n=1 Tax=Acanthamoeba castellanii (strain ATCC 30010 / Neff) TaxID=1257118 RepID=L8GF82_ACACF|nr:uncharacterized protein ACA1_136080 [Acanthamoeba castellanii str. Neff]ELR11398.1 hypothetical protein ACA1_136080 [Acanthamoeba castellanii str. Neff]